MKHTEFFKHNPLNYHRFDNKEDLEKNMENSNTTESIVQELSNDRVISVGFYNIEVICTWCRVETSKLQ